MPVYASAEQAVAADRQSYVQSVQPDARAELAPDESGDDKKDDSGRDCSLAILFPVAQGTRRWWKVVAARTTARGLVLEA